MLLLLMTLTMQDLIEKAEARGEPYTAWKGIKDLLEVFLLIFIEIAIFTISHIILHTPDIQQSDAWVKPTIYVLTFIVMFIVAIGYAMLVDRVERITRDRRKSYAIK